MVFRNLFYSHSLVASGTGFSFRPALQFLMILAGSLAIQSGIEARCDAHSFEINSPGLFSSWKPLPVVTPIPFSSLQPRTKLPEEPEEFDTREVEAYYDWRNNMFFRRFDLEGTGSVDYMTARRTYKVWQDDFGTPVVITMADPLFYWIDLNRNGTFEQDKGEMWSDPHEDGLTGNERPYDSSDLQQLPSEIPSWSAPDPSTPH